MEPTSKMLSLALGILFAMAVSGQSSAHAFIQETTGASVGSKASSTDSGSNQEAPSPDEKPDDKGGPVQTTDQSAQADGSGQQPAAGGQDQKAKAAGNGGSAKDAQQGGAKGKSKALKEAQQPTTRTAVGGQSPIHTAAQQILDSLDAAISVAQKSEAPGSGPALRDISVSRKQLEQKAQAAGKDDNAWADVATGAARVLADALKLVQTDSGNHAASGQAGTSPAAPPPTDDRERFFQSRELPLYIAGLALILSVLGLGIGWLLARRAVNRALIEAGLL
jgi:hypothetical protein